MDDLTHLLTEGKNATLPAVPTFFDLSKESDAENVRLLFTSGAIRRISDDYKEAQLELFGVNNPAKVYTPDFKNEFAAYYEGLGDTVKHGVWVYFPWISTLTHILTQDDFFAVRTARNKNLITKEEQEKFYNASIGIAVVKAADNGDNAVVDVERYDLDANTPFFQGRLGAVTYEQLASLDKFGIGKTITKHIGPENVTVRMQESLLEMGKTIVSWPQLGGAALINGAAVAYCVRRILNGQSIEGNRALISLDERLIPEYQTDAEQLKRKNAAESFRKIFGL